MLNTAKGNKLHDNVEPLPIPGGWAYGYLCGYKSKCELLKGSRWSIGFGCYYSDLTSYFNSGVLDKKEKYLIGVGREFFLRDYTKLIVGEQITDWQKKLCEQLHKGVQKHLALGMEKVYSDADPIRLWLSVLKHHKEAVFFTQIFMREAETRNGKKLYECEHLLMPSDYDNADPYGLTTVFDFEQFCDIPNANGLHPLTKEQLAERKGVQPTHAAESRAVNPSQFAQPKRNSISDTRAPHYQSSSYKTADNGAKSQQQRAVNPFAPASSKSALFVPCKVFRIEDTPPRPTKARKFCVE